MVPSSALAAAAAALLLAAAPVAAERPATPIEHVIVLYQENVAFDHYFATYPQALNRPGEPFFAPAPGTPSINGLTPALVAHNPNSAAPRRLAPGEAMTCDMDHEYRAEQEAFDGGLMDRFVEFTDNHGARCPADGVMAYFDGNTVTALWNYAQHFALSDNSFATQFGPSTPGALNLVAGTTRGASPPDLVRGDSVLTLAGTMMSDVDPLYDDCSNPANGLAEMSGRTIADLLDAQGITWGWFQGGFAPTARAGGKAVCGAASTNLAGARIRDYSPHHDPFQYYRGRANPHHLPPSAPAMVGRGDAAQHQYDLAEFYAALAAGRLPQVSFVKAKRVQDGHAGYSDPLDEQAHLVDIVNAVERSIAWPHAAIIIAYDDSDGWYDHVMPPILFGSAVPGLDALNGPGRCGRPAPGADPGRCGYGPRLPLLVISPYARVNAVDHGLTDQTSIIRFIEDNWRLGRLGGGSRDEAAGSLAGLFDFSAPHARALFLDPRTGETARPAEKAN